jgi:hypothetical protein
MDVNEYFDLYNCYITWNMRLIEILVGIYTGDIYIYIHITYIINHVQFGVCQNMGDAPTLSNHGDSRESYGGFGVAP